jgi:prefoldin subunit 5
MRVMTTHVNRGSGSVRNNSLDTALRVALIGSLIIVLLCVLSFGLRGFPANTRPQDVPYIDTRQYVALPPQPTQPLSFHHVHHGEVVSTSSLASLRRKVDALTSDRQQRRLSDQLATIEARISQLSESTGNRRPTHAELHTVSASSNPTHRRLDEVESQINDRLTRMSVARESGIRHLNESMQRLNQSVGGLSGTVVEVGRSVRLLNEQHAMLRQAVEQRQRGTTAQVSSNSEQIQNDVTKLVQELDELKSQIAGLKQTQPSFIAGPVSDPGLSAPISVATPDEFPHVTRPLPELTAVSRTELQPSLNPPPATETQSDLPLAPASVEPDQPEPFPAGRPTEPVEPLRPEILPQSATIPPAAGVTAIVEPATLEVSVPKQVPVPQPATLSPNWTPSPGNTLQIEPAATPAVLSELSVQEIALPAPKPIRQMSGDQGSADGTVVTPLPTYDVTPAAESARTYRFAATVMHVSANSESATARAGLVRLEDKGGSNEDHAVGHDAMVQKLMRNARRYGSAEVVNSGLITVTPTESGRLAIGSPCLHCNTVHGVDAGDQVVLTWNDGWIQVHGEAPERMARVESLPATEFQPPESAASTTWLISEQAQEGTVSDTDGNNEGELEFVQRLIVITRLASDTEAPALMQVQGVEAQSDRAVAIDSSSARNSPATFYESTTVPRLLNEEAIRDAVLAPKPTQQRRQVASPRTRRGPLGLIRSVFRSRKSE